MNGQVKDVIIKMGEIRCKKVDRENGTIGLRHEANLEGSYYIYFTMQLHFKYPSSYKTIYLVIFFVLVGHCMISMN